MPTLDLRRLDARGGEALARAPRLAKGWTELDGSPHQGPLRAAAISQGCSQVAPPGQIGASTGSTPFKGL